MKTYLSFAWDCPIGGFGDYIGSFTEIEVAKQAVEASGMPGGSVFDTITKTELLFDGNWSNSPISKFSEQWWTHPVNGDVFIIIATGFYGANSEEMVVYSSVVDRRVFVDNKKWFYANHLSFGPANPTGSITEFARAVVKRQMREADCPVRIAE